MPDPYALPTYQEAYDTMAPTDPRYASGASILDTQSADEAAALGGQKTATINNYATQRQNTIRGYQDALDNINLTLKGVGIQTRADQAQRGLYDASGAVSGIGQGVAAANVAPYLQDIGKIATRQTEDLNTLSRDETTAIGQIDQQIAALPGKTAQQKAALRQQIVDSILQAATSDRTFNYNRDQDTMTRQQQATDKANSAPTSRQSQEGKGREYLGTPQAVAAARKAGRTIMKVGKDMYAASPEEELTMASKAATIENTRSITANRGNKAAKNTRSTQNPGAPNSAGAVQTNASGGLSFFNAKGKAITAADYAKANNMSIADVLKGSRDAGDQEYINDVNTLYASIGQYGADGTVLTKAKVDAKLKELYPHIYGTSR